MSRNNFWVLITKQAEERQIFTSWAECEEELRHASRSICCGFPTEEEAQKFRDGRWKRGAISGEAKRWLEEYKARPGQLTPDAGWDLSALSEGEYPRYCAYVDGSYNDRTRAYGFGVVFIRGEKIETFYGGGAQEDLAEMGCGAGELLACMEAIKYAEALNLPKLTIRYDSQIIQWAYYGLGKSMLSEAAGQYMEDMREKGMRLKAESIEGLSHKKDEEWRNTPEHLAERAANDLADRLAKKGAGIAD